MTFSRETSRFVICFMKHRETWAYLKDAIKPCYLRAIERLSPAWRQSWGAFWHYFITLEPNFVKSIFSSFVELKILFFVDFWTDRGS